MNNFGKFEKITIVDSAIHLSYNWPQAISQKGPGILGRLTMKNGHGFGRPKFRGERKVFLNDFLVIEISVACIRKIASILTQPNTETFLGYSCFLLL